MFKQTIFLFSILLAFSCNTPADSPYDPITFVKKSVMSEIGRASAVGFVIADKGYVALGRTAVRSGALNDCWQYNPELDSWTKKKTFPGIARVNAMAEVVKGKAYVGLGYNISIGAYGGGNLTDLWMYDPIDDSWTKKAGLDGLSTATNSCVSFVLNDEIYILAGFDGATFSDEFWKYNPLQGELGTWTKLNGSPRPRSGAVLCANAEHIFFGTGYKTLSENDWWEYYPKSDSWKQLKSMPDTGRENATSLTVDNRFFVSTGMYFGGTLTSGKLKSDIMEYDALRNVWYKRGNIPNGERENAISFTINGKGYIGFGENETTVLNDLWSFEP